MARRKKKSSVEGAPAWMVTYGDMMGLLLCFFVILVSMSEIKENKRFQEVMDSIRTAFGYDGAIGRMPVQRPTKNSILMELRALALPQYEQLEGDSDSEGMHGRVFRVTNVREGIKLVIGGQVSFDRFQAELKPEAERLVAGIASKVAGHNTVLQVRGHATREPLPADSPFADPMDLSLARARAVADTLERYGVDARRLRIMGAGCREPLVAQAYTEDRRALNRRVEIVVTEALVEDYSGAPMPLDEKDADDGG